MAFLTTDLTTHSVFILEKLLVGQMVKKFPTYKKVK